MGSYYSKNNYTVPELKNKINEQSNIIEKFKHENNSLKILNNQGYKPKYVEEIQHVKDNKSYEYLVLSGGSTKAITECGALQELDQILKFYNDNGVFKLKGLAGTSAGSIIIGLLSVGYTPCELCEIVGTLDLIKLFCDNTTYFRESLDLIQKYGLCPGEYLLEFLGGLIEKKTGNKDYTLENLYNDKNIKLVIVTTNYSFKKSEYLYAGNPDAKYSNIPIRIAIRMSMSIPYVFEPYCYNDCLFVDGGLLDNFPIHVFDGEYPGDPKARLNICEPNPKVLGFNIMTNNDTINYEICQKKIYNNLYEYSNGFIDLFLIENERRLMTPAFWLRSIIIVTPNYSLDQYNLSNEQKTELIQIGKKYVSEFFN